MRRLYSLFGFVCVQRLIGPLFGVKYAFSGFMYSWRIHHFSVVRFLGFAVAESGVQKALVCQSLFLIRIGN